MSKASEDLPEPERPVMTMNLFRGISRFMFLRLWTRAFFIIILFDLRFIEISLIRRIWLISQISSLGVIFRFLGLCLIRD